MTETGKWGDFETEKTTMTMRTANISRRKGFSSLERNEQG